MSSETIEELENSKLLLEKELNAFQEDIEDMLRLSRIYEVKKTEKFLQIEKLMNEKRSLYDNICREIKTLGRKMKVEKTEHG